MAQKGTRKILKRIVLALLAVAVICAVGFVMYMNDYYHADEAAIAAAVGNEDGDAAASAGIDAGSAGSGSAGSGGGVVEVRKLSNGALAFVPDNPRVGFVFYPGGKVQPESYAPLMRQCADQEILCVLAAPPFNFALFDIDAAVAVQRQFPDVGAWYIGGHSLGGVAATMCVANHPDRFTGLVLLAAYPDGDLSGYEGAVLSIVGSNDGVLNRAKYEEARSKLPADAQEVVIEGGNHAYYGNYGEQIGDGAATISREEQQRQTVAAIVAING